MTGKPYVVAGRTYVPHRGPGYDREGWASWYGTAFHGRLTANGEVFDRGSIAAAHPTLPLPSYVRVTNQVNRRSMIVRVNDRGPYEHDRVIDVSEQVADALGFKRGGISRVRVQYVGRASVHGSDDGKLLATLRTDGSAAPSGAVRERTMLASLREEPRPAPPQEGRGVDTRPTARLARHEPDGPRPVARAAEPLRGPVRAGAVTAATTVATPPTRPPVIRMLSSTMSKASDDEGRAGSPPMSIRPPERSTLAEIY